MSRHIPFVLALGLQLLILVATPARNVTARLTGTPITLATAPVDPYDLLSGYYVTLSYRAEQSGTCSVSGDEELWLIVEQAEPSARFVEVKAVKPETLEPGVVAVRARCRLSRPQIVRARRYYIPESERAEVERAIRDAGGALVDMRVGADGEPAILRLRAGDKTW